MKINVLLLAAMVTALLKLAHVLSQESAQSVRWNVHILTCLVRYLCLGAARLKQTCQIGDLWTKYDPFAPSVWPSVVVLAGEGF